MAEPTRSRARAGIAAGVILLTAIAASGTLQAQERLADVQTLAALQPADSLQQPNTPAASPKEAEGQQTTEAAEKTEKQEATPRKEGVPCVQPPPMVSLQDYQGPFKKVVGGFARTVERKSVHPPNYKAGAVLCTLVVKDKFILFVKDTFDPFTFFDTGVDAGIDQASDSDPSFGQGAMGYAKRFGADFTGHAVSKFFKDFAYPVIFSEDPRYYRKIHGSTKSRFLYALQHTFVAHREDGRHMFNYSEWLGTASAVAMGNLYHPDNERGLGPAAWRMGQSLLFDMGWDVLREFWPEISHKLKLPFRDQPHPESEHKYCMGAGFGIQGAGARRRRGWRALIMNEPNCLLGEPSLLALRQPKV